MSRSVDTLTTPPPIPGPRSVSELSDIKLGEYTHLRHNDATILVRDWRREGPDTFILTVRWPAGGGAGGYDPRLLAQTIRQCGLLVAHAEFGVPTDHQTLLHTLNITVEPGFKAHDGAEFEVGLTVTRAAGRSTSLAMVFRIRRGATTVCLAETEFGWVSPAAYRRLRGRHTALDWGQWPLPSPLPPELVGRAQENDVLLAHDGGRWKLRSDVSNILLFDHPVDHVPGLVLLEAAQQAAHTVTYPQPVELTDVTIRYANYVEFDEPCWIEVELLPVLLRGWFSLDVRGRQRGQVAFQARLMGMLPQ